MKRLLLVLSLFVIASPTIMHANKTFKPGWNAANGLHPTVALLLGAAAISSAISSAKSIAKRAGVAGTVAYAGYQTYQTYRLSSQLETLHSPIIQRLLKDEHKPTIHDKTLKTIDSSKIIATGALCVGLAALTRRPVLFTAIGSLSAGYYAKTIRTHCINDIKEVMPRIKQLESSYPDSLSKQEVSSLKSLVPKKERSS